MDKNRYNNGVKTTCPAPDYRQIVGNEAYSAITNGMDFDSFMPLGPGRYCLYSDSYSARWVVGKISEFSGLYFNSNGTLCIPVETNAGIVLMKPCNVRGILTDKGFKYVFKVCRNTKIISNP